MKFTLHLDITTGSDATDLAPQYDTTLDALVERAHPDDASDHAELDQRVRPIGFHAPAGTHRGDQS